MSAVHYNNSYTEARSHLKDLLDAAGEGRVATVRCDTDDAAVVDAERLRYALAVLRPSSAEVVVDNDGWSLWLPALPVGADGATLDEAIDETVVALREYADNWQDRLRNVSNHREHWGLMQLISLGTDAQLRDWLVGARE
ncbi:prevent-host-death protein [Nocardia cyriacigeorgica]|uniref:Prevent-host-death protein n=1 Tax=Nocardia cyriacigeorgica TaxID=135487 RepID=A0A5R8PAD0_9NOCA|nr:prevent-host-death protein [Nocardia cyriacigeorgica]TLG04763.1 prevent-host-death protein [Nocardia cyriacigeorgica]